MVVYHIVETKQPTKQPSNPSRRMRGKCSALAIIRTITTDATCRSTSSTNFVTNQARGWTGARLWVAPRRLPLETGLQPSLARSDPLPVIIRRQFFHSSRPLHAKKEVQGATIITRAERRAMERKQRNEARREQQRLSKEKHNLSSSASFFSWSSRFGQALQGRLRDLFHLRVVGSGQRFHSDHLKALVLSYRLPLACALVYLWTHPDISPYVVQASAGPSMLPTIQCLGDVWLVETGAWCRFLQARSFWNLQRGDVVLWKDERTGRVSCKRIIGMEGDVVKRYGQYAHLYQTQGGQNKNTNNRYGIFCPKNAETETVGKSPHAWDKHFPLDNQQADDDNDVDRTWVVPAHQVWLEGDCPPFSLDSRHYGPIPMDWICGRLVLRLWPWSDNVYFEGLPSRQSRWIRTIPRPTPFSSPEKYLGKPFNFYRISPVQGDDQTSKATSKDEVGGTHKNIETNSN